MGEGLCPGARPLTEGRGRCAPRSHASTSLLIRAPEGEIVASTGHSSRTPTGFLTSSTQSFSLLVANVIGAQAILATNWSPCMVPRAQCQAFSTSSRSQGVSGWAISGTTAGSTTLSLSTG